MGVVFDAKDAKEPATVKSWVRDALAAKGVNLKSEPKAKKKCVRVIYSDGYQCDFPVFKRTALGPSFCYEIGIGQEWIASDPGAINSWFENVVKDRSPEQEGSLQLRRIVRLVKYFSKVHAAGTGRAFPAGLVVTALAVECYRPTSDGDDRALLETLGVLALRDPHAPVLANGSRVSGNKDPERIERLRVAAAEAVKALSGVRRGYDVTDEQIRKAWKAVFKHSYFDSALKEEKKSFDYSSGVAPGLIGLSDQERLRRAEAATQAVESRGAQSKPWIKSD